MPKIFTANSSSVLINGTVIDGVQGIDYRLVRQQSDVYGVGSSERLTVYYGSSHVEGRIQVASASPDLDALAASGASFQMVATLAHGDTTRSVALDECYMSGKEFSLNSGSHGESTYSFTATRVREEDAGAAAAGGGGA
jgi:hypothetical protein